MNQSFLGIDISKKTFDVALLVKNDAKAKKFNNNKQGFLKLLTWINNKEIILSQACMESTGTYGEALANFLYSNDVPISVVNPARIKGFSQSELTRNKNDILDATPYAQKALYLLKVPMQRCQEKQNQTLFVTPTINIICLSLYS